MYNNSSSSELWLEKYRPKTLETYLDYAKYKYQIEQWIEPIRDRQATSRPFLVLHGEPGTGKTTLAHCIMKHWEYDVIECNASDTRSKSSLSQLINTGKRSVVSCDNNDTDSGYRNIGIIMDELDGISQGEHGGIAALMDFVFIDKINKSEKKYRSKDYRIRYPVIATTNSIKEDKLEPVLQFGVVIKVNEPSVDALQGLAVQICKAESIPLDKTQIRQIIMTTTRDYRSIINTLYMIHTRLLNKIPLGSSDAGLLALNLNSINDAVAAICKENILLGQLNHVTDLPMHKMISGIVTNLPYYKSIVSNPSIDSNEIDPIYKHAYSHKLLYIIESDSLYFYLDLLDNMPRLLLPICHEIVGRKLSAATAVTAPGTKKSSKSSQPTPSPPNGKQLLKNVIELMSKIGNNFLVCEPYWKWVEGLKDWRLQQYINYIACYANICILNDINHTRIKQAAICTELDTEYHKTYNNYKTTNGRNKNYLLFGNNNYSGNTKNVLTSPGAAILAPSIKRLDARLHILGQDIELFHMANNLKINNSVKSKKPCWTDTKSPNHPLSSFNVNDKNHNFVVKSMALTL